MQRRNLKNRGSWNRKPADSKTKNDTLSKTPGPIPTDLEGKRAYLENWATENRIPGKIQSWFTVPVKSDACDWRILSQHMSKGNRILSIEGPFKGAKPPKLVLDVDSQIRKPHLSKFRGSILQIWFRATGDGRFGIAVQNILHSAEATREFKTFLDYLEREHSGDVLCCHQIRVSPVQTFDPAHPIPGSHIEFRKGFGSRFIPIGGSDQKYNVIDWAPACKGPWIGLPKRIREMIHPAKGDRLLECFAGPAYIAEALSKDFEDCFAADVRPMDRQTPNVRYIHAAIDKEFFPKFFRGKSKDGKWTIYLDPPAGKALSGSVIPEIAASHPERILLNSSNLAVALQEIKRFRREGYMLRKIVPMDLEPGNPSIHLLLLFVPDRAGLLGHREERKGKVLRTRENQKAENESQTKTILFSQKRRR